MKKPGFDFSDSGFMTLFIKHVETLTVVWFLEEIIKDSLSVF